jgi:hypothetical protein
VSNPRHQILHRDLEEIAVNHREIRRRARPQLSCEIPVDFEPEDVCRAGGERSGQRATAGPDFKKRLVSRRRNRGNQLVDPGALEKMLTESLPGEWPALNREVVTG